MVNTQIIGLGYIGLPTAILTSSAGLKTHGFDINLSKLEDITNSNILTKEAGLKEQLNNVLLNGNLTVSNSVVSAEVHLIVVPTPIDYKLNPDVSIVVEAIHTILPFLKAEDLIIIESTCPINTTEKLKSIIYKARPELTNSLYISYCPERVLPGNIFYELKHNDRIVGGINIESSLKAKEFYENFVDGKIHLTNSRTAEMCKLVENSARDHQIAFANELSIICDKSDIDVWELISLANKHPRVNILNPGIGVGGHCIAVDPWFLVSEFPNEAKNIRLARETNNYKTNWCINKIIEIINVYNKENTTPPRIACMGLSYKPNVDDLRESPAINIVNHLIEIGHDIYCVEPNIIRHDSFKIYPLKEVVNNVDIVVWLVPHQEFKNLNIDQNVTQIDLCGINKN